MARKALFPVSPSNSRFSTKVSLAALGGIVEQYEELLFIFADQLQLYNKACEVSPENSLLNVIEQFALRRESYLDERKKWLQSIRTQCERTHRIGKWMTYGVRDLTDESFFGIYRRVLIAFHTVADFRRDVTRAAEEHCNRNYAPGSIEMEIRLSEAYILEEIALSVRIHVLEDVCAEYYIGQHLIPMLNVYAGVYGIDVFTLAGVSKRNDPFRFYEYPLDDSVPRWREVGMPQ